MTLLSIVLTATIIEPCIAEVTVRDGPTLGARRVGVLKQGQTVELLETGSERQRLDLTIDKNVALPLTISPEDVWLRVRLAAGDAGATEGWVFGGLMCPPWLEQSDRAVAVLSWDVTHTVVAFVERATDSFACVWGRPSSVRVVDWSTQRVLAEVRDDCPAAPITVSARARIEGLLKKIWPHLALGPVDADSRDGTSAASAHEDHLERGLERPNRARAREGRARLRRHAFALSRRSRRRRWSDAGLRALPLIGRSSSALRAHRRTPTRALA